MNVKGTLILGGIGLFCAVCVFIVIDLQEQSALRTGMPRRSPMTRVFDVGVGREVAYGDYTDQWGNGRYGPICPGCRNPVNQDSTSCGRGCPTYRWVSGICKYCAGKGTVTCSRCNGKGSYNTCHACELSKRVGRPPSDRANCYNCKGTGVEPHRVYRCSDCGERGSHQCTYCRGVGRWS